MTSQEQLAFTLSLLAGLPCDWIAMPWNVWQSYAKLISRVISWWTVDTAGSRGMYKPECGLNTWWQGAEIPEAVIHTSLIYSKLRHNNNLVKIVWTWFEYSNTSRKKCVRRWQKPTKILPTTTHLLSFGW